MTKEIKVYVCNCEHDGGFDFRPNEYAGQDENIMQQAERLGTVYSLKGFQDAINDEELSLENSFILIK